MKERKLNSKHRFIAKECPCGKSNQDGKFVPFEGCIKFGYCHSCSKMHVSSTENEQRTDKKAYSVPINPVTFIPYHYLVKSIRLSKQNNFISFLTGKFGTDIAEYLRTQYKIGTSKQWYGANVFWYVDRNNNTRTGKIMLYNKLTGKRIKEPYSHITWVHRKLKIPNESIANCLFGEHLISQFPVKPIAIVESEKSAIIASVFFDKFIWLATGGIGNLTYNKLKSLKGRNIILFPDLGAFDLWDSKVNYLKKWFNISISNYLEINASETDKELKFDIADYLTQNKNIN